MVDHLVRKTIVFCEQKRPEMAGIEAEQFQDLLVHRVSPAVRQAPLKRLVYAMGSALAGIRKPGIEPSEVRPGNSGYTARG